MDLSLRKYLEDYTDWPLTELYSLSNNPYLWTKEESLLKINAKCYLETLNHQREHFFAGFIGDPGLHLNASANLS